MEFKYYKLNRVLSFNAFLNILIGERGVGKTFSVSDFCTSDFINKNNRFAYIRRFKSELNETKTEFFEKIKNQDKYKDKNFKVNGNLFEIDNETAGYAIPLTKAQKLKSKNFTNVKNIVFDEAFLEPGQGYYLQNEVMTFLGLIETIARLDDVRVFILSNATDLANPYFMFFNLHLPYNSDIVTFKDNTILVNYIKNEPYREAKKETKFGKLVEGTEYENYAIDNKFMYSDNNFIEKKPQTASFVFSFLYKNTIYGIWRDTNLGKYYVCDTYLRNKGYCFALTLSDFKPNTLLYSTAKNFICWKNFIKNYRLGNVRFQNQKIKSITYDIMKNFIL
mgnify:FL=1